MLQDITQKMSRDDFGKLRLYFHANNKKNYKNNIVTKTDEEVAKMFLTQEISIGEFAYDVKTVQQFLEVNWLQCTHKTRSALIEELWLSDYVLARIENVMGNQDLALEFYQKAVSADTEQEHPELIIEFANLLAEKWNYPKSEEIYNIIIHWPHPEWALFTQNKLWNLYFAKGQYKEALQSYKKATESFNPWTLKEAHANLSAMYDKKIDKQIDF